MVQGRTVLAVIVNMIWVLVVDQWDMLADLRLIPNLNPNLILIPTAHQKHHTWLAVTAPTAVAENFLHAAAAAPINPASVPVAARKIGSWR